MVPIPEHRSDHPRQSRARPSNYILARAPVLAPGTALGVLLSRALSSAQAVFHSRGRTFRYATTRGARTELSPDALGPLPACESRSAKITSSSPVSLSAGVT